MTVTDDHDQEPGRLRQQIEEANARAAAAESERDELRSESLFRGAGLDPADKQHAAFMRGYEGLMEKDAVKAYVADLGVTSEPAPPPPPLAPVVDDQEAAALQAMTDASRGSGAPEPAPNKEAEIRAKLEALPWGAPMSERNELLYQLTEARGYKAVRD